MSQKDEKNETGKEKEKIPTESFINKFIPNVTGINEYLLKNDLITKSRASDLYAQVSHLELLACGIALDLTIEVNLMNNSEYDKIFSTMMEKLFQNWKEPEVQLVIVDFSMSNFERALIKILYGLTHDIKIQTLNFNDYMLPPLNARTIIDHFIMAVTRYDSNNYSFLNITDYYKSLQEKIESSKKTFKPSSKYQLFSQNMHYINIITDHYRENKDPMKADVDSLIKSLELRAENENEEGFVTSRQVNTDIILPLQQSPVQKNTNNHSFQESSPDLTEMSHWTEENNAKSFFDQVKVDIPNFPDLTFFSALLKPEIVRALVIMEILRNSQVGIDLANPEMPEKEKARYIESRVVLPSMIRNLLNRRGKDIDVDKIFPDLLSDLLGEIVNSTVKKFVEERMKVHQEIPKFQELFTTFETTITRITAVLQSDGNKPLNVREDPPLFIPIEKEDTPALIDPTPEPKKVFQTAEERRRLADLEQKKYEEAMRQLEGL